jgi:hypothetical protein
MKYDYYSFPLLGAECFLLFISRRMYRPVREVSPGMFEDHETSTVFAAHESLIIRNLRQALPSTKLKHRVLFCRASGELDFIYQ